MNIGAVNSYAQRLDLAAMKPSTSVCSTSFCLVNPGIEYLIYQPDGGTFFVSLQAGNYSYEWFNPSSATLTSTGTIIAEGGSQSFNPPFGGDAVLYLKSAGLAAHGLYQLLGLISPGASDLTCHLKLFATPHEYRPRRSVARLFVQLTRRSSIQNVGEHDCIGVVE